ncbi:transcriptional regulator [Streptomyces sp. SL13]|uniref:Transcriptional regulator n=1 Tax=Streptantibioticus silvisoli TaxID=2705255 RepID=A0AA90H370_9ACTN|nr:transcriptional regulator [Streptantibioticus silvisoli]MDI5965558.1 transcriptional regulator [Streptantibioticus silvisoli]MDI5972579.1 transcriptional regulator [Streptantibioticus silvisoli]
MTRPLSQTLARLAGERATGALLRDAGTLYLVDGVAVHAESPFSPGIGWLLTAGGRLPVAVWQEAVERAGARCAIARALVDSCRLSTGAVEIAGLSALFDAAFFVLGPSDGPSWFRPGVRHWFGALRSVPLRELERETARRRRYLEAVWPHPALDTAPVVRRAASARLPRPPVRRAAVLDLADGRLTPAGIAAALGRPAFHTLVDVRRLAALGHVATPSAEPERPPARPAPSAPPDPGAAAGPLDVATLRRVRDALEARL